MDYPLDLMLPALGKFYQTLPISDDSDLFVQGAKVKSEFYS